MSDLENLIVQCIRAVLISEGYSPDRAKSAINWSYHEIKDIIEREGIKI